MGRMLRIVHFHVGASVLLDNGHIYTGNNQENVAYPSGLCAERVALFHAMSKNPQATVSAVAITAHAEDFETQQNHYPLWCVQASIA